MPIGRSKPDTWVPIRRRNEEADNLQRRRYAEAALTGMFAAMADADITEFPPPNKAAKDAFDYADAMLTEQRRREGTER